MKKLFLLMLMVSGLVASNYAEAYCSSCPSSVSYGYYSPGSYWNDGGCCRGNLHWGTYRLGGYWY